MALGDWGGRTPDGNGEGGSFAVPVDSLWTRSLGRFLRFPLFVVDAKGNLAYFNQPAEQLLGSRYAEVGPLPVEEWSALWAPTNVEGAPIPFEQLPVMVALRERRPTHGWLNVVGLDGLHRRVEATAFPLEDPHGEVFGAAAVFWELNDRMR